MALPDAPRAVTAEELLADLPAPPADDGMTDLANRAQAAFGYEPLKTKVVQEIEKPVDERHLLALLREHDVPVFRPDDVERYRKAMVAGVKKRYNVWIALW